jgi:PAS domain S-box-containing protein
MTGAFVAAEHAEVTIRVEEGPTDIEAGTIVLEVDLDTSGSQPIPDPDSGGLTMFEGVGESFSENAVHGERTRWGQVGVDGIALHLDRHSSIAREVAGMHLERPRSAEFVELRRPESAGDCPDALEGFDDFTSRLVEGSTGLVQLGRTGFRETSLCHVDSDEGGGKELGRAVEKLPGQPLPLHFLCFGNPGSQPPLPIAGPPQRVKHPVHDGDDAGHVAIGKPGDRHARLEITLLHPPDHGLHRSEWPEGKGNEKCVGARHKEHAQCEPQLQPGVGNRARDQGPGSRGSPDQEGGRHDDLQVERNAEQAPRPRLRSRSGHLRSSLRGLWWWIPPKGCNFPPPDLSGVGRTSCGEILHTPSSPAAGEGVTEARFSDYRAVFEASPDGIVVVDGRGRISAANSQALRMLGYTLDELLGQPVEIMVPPDVRGRHVTLRDGFMERPASRPMGADMELKAVRKDGREFPVDVALRPVGQGGDRFVIAVIRDTSRERRMQTLGTGTMRATEEERKRIARELHDDTAQSLAATMMRLGVLARTTDEEARARIHAELNETLEGLVEGVRRIAQGLRPPALEDVGVEAAIRSHVRKSLDRTRMAVALHLESVEDRLGPEAQLVVYRVVQEALSNVLRHSDARNVEVRLEVEGEGEDARVVATVTDDGRGFDAEGEFLAGAGLGLLGMDERARLIGGRLTLASAPGEGCLVRLRIPAPDGVASSPDPETANV